MNRTGNVVRNTIWKIGSSLLCSGISFICRWFFVRYIGDTLLGVNSLFCDVLILFSFAEMGIGSALTFCLYKPIAQNDIPKIQSFLQLYKWMYRGVMVLVTVIGVGFFPFLSQIKSNNPIPNLYLYYVIFLINNVLSYACAYKKSYVEACQKAYSIQHITLITSLGCNIFQILAIFFTGDYEIYLYTMLVFQIVSIVWNDRYISNHFPETVFHHAARIEKTEWKEIKRQISGLMIQKTGTLGITQTDSIIVSMVVNVVEWGYVSNYNTIRTLLNGLLYHVYSSILPSMGNALVVEKTDRQKQLFRLYNFINEWIYYNSFICFAFLATPLVQIFFGEQRTLQMLLVALIAFNLFFSGLLYPIVGLKEAKGLFTVGKWLPFGASIVNLVTSIVFVKLWGTTGVFIGTVCSTIVQYIQPYLIWKKLYGKGIAYYYWSTFKTLLVGVVTFIGLYRAIYVPIWEQWEMVWVIRLMVLGIVALLLSNIIFILFNWENESMKEFLIRVKKK